MALVFFALAAAGASESRSAPPGLPTGVPGDSSLDWAQTQLDPQPALKEQYDRTRAFLDDEVSEVDGQISRLKSEGVIDRRSATKIRSALKNARASMTGMAGGMQENEQIDGWNARMFAFELGMAADTLTQNARSLEANLGATTGGSHELEDGRSAKREQQRKLVQTLEQTGNLLRKTARAITENLK